MKSLKLNLLVLSVLATIGGSAYAQNSSPYRSVDTLTAPQLMQSTEKTVTVDEELKLKKENLCFSNEKSGRTQFNHGPEGNKIMLDRTAYKCYLNYNLVYDPVTVTPVFVSQNLKNTTRVLTEFATFHRVDPNLTAYRQATVDYGDTDMEPLSLAPTADMDLKGASGQEKGQAIEESLYFTNTVPVVPGFKNGVWADIEEMVRVWSKDKELSVTTGVIFDNLEQPALYGPSQIWIPTRLYKAVYEPATGRSIAFVVPNVQIVTQRSPYLNPGTEDYWQTLPKYSFNCKSACSAKNFITSVDQVEKAANVNLFPNAPSGVDFKKIAPSYWGVK